MKTFFYVLGCGIVAGLIGLAVIAHTLVNAMNCSGG